MGSLIFTDYVQNNEKHLAIQQKLLSVRGIVKIKSIEQISWHCPLNKDFWIQVRNMLKKIRENKVV